LESDKREIDSWQNWDEHLLNDQEHKSFQPRLIPNIMMLFLHLKGSRGMLKILKNPISILLLSVRLITVTHFHAIHISLFSRIHYLAISNIRFCTLNSIWCFFLLQNSGNSFQLNEKKIITQTNDYE
jgi:hypothetical protein